MCACVRACVRACVCCVRAFERACILMYVKHWDDYVLANGRDLVLCTYAQNSALKIDGLIVCIRSGEPRLMRFGAVFNGCP